MFTTKKILGYVTASFLIGSAMAGPAHAIGYANGKAYNGVAYNGAMSNGVTPNGVTPNGTTLNGEAFNGNAFNGAYLNGSDKNGVADKDRETRGFDFNGVTTRDVILNSPRRWEAK